MGATLQEKWVKKGDINDAKIAIRAYNTALKAGIGQLAYNKFKGKIEEEIDIFK